MQGLAFERMLTELDHVRLTNLVQRYKRAGSLESPTLQIEHLLDAAEIVPGRELPPDVVTMYSRVQLKNRQDGTHSELTLCYPHDADAGAGFVSVLSPVGFNLLGQKVGATVRWPTPSGGELTAEIERVLFQPESSGDFAT